MKFLIQLILAPLAIYLGLTLLFMVMMFLGVITP